MNTLWTFGDSFTYGHGCRPDGPWPEYFHNYKKDSDDVWPELLGQMIDMEVKNFGECGASNDFIIDSLIDNWDNIKKDDLVIMGITYYNRFDIPMNDRLLSIFWDWDKFVLDNIRSQFTLDERKCIVDFQYFFSDDEMYKIRHLKRFNFLNKILKKKKITTFLWDVDYYQYTNRFEKIADATNGEMKDYHFSFKGHRDFADMLYKKIITPTLI